MVIKQSDLRTYDDSGEQAGYGMEYGQVVKWDSKNQTIKDGNEGWPTIVCVYDTDTDELE